MKEPLSLYVQIHMDNVGVVTLDKNNNNRVFSKIYIQDLDIKFSTLQSGQMILKLQIEDVKGSYLLEKNQKFYEKGFIGEFLVTKVYKPLNNDELK